MKARCFCIEFPPLPKNKGTVDIEFLAALEYHWGFRLSARATGGMFHSPGCAFRH